MNMEPAGHARNECDSERILRLHNYISLELQDGVYRLSEPLSL